MVWISFFAVYFLIHFIKFRFAPAQVLFWELKKKTVFETSNYTDVNTSFMRKDLENVKPKRLVRELGIMKMIECNGQNEFRLFLWFLCLCLSNCSKWSCGFWMRSSSCRLLWPHLRFFFRVLISFTLRNSSSETYSIIIHESLVILDSILKPAVKHRISTPYLKSI